MILGGGGSERQHFKTRRHGHCRRLASKKGGDQWNKKDDFKYRQTKKRKKESPAALF